MHSAPPTAVIATITAAARLYFRLNGLLRWLAPVLSIIATIVVSPLVQFQLSIPMKAVASVYAVYFGMVGVLLWSTAPMPNNPTGVGRETEDDVEVHQRWGSFLFYLGSLVGYLHFGCSDAAGSSVTPHQQHSPGGTAEDLLSAAADESMGFLQLDALVAAHLIYSLLSAAVFISYYWPSLPSARLPVSLLVSAGSGKQFTANPQPISHISNGGGGISNSRQWLSRCSRLLVWTCRLYAVGVVYRTISRSKLPIPPMPTGLSPLLLLWIVALTERAARQAVYVAKTDRPKAWAKLLVLDGYGLTAPLFAAIFNGLNCPPGESCSPHWTPIESIGYVALNCGLFAYSALIFYTFNSIVQQI